MQTSNENQSNPTTNKKPEKEKATGKKKSAPVAEPVKAETPAKPEKEKATQTHEDFHPSADNLDKNPEKPLEDKLEDFKGPINDHVVTEEDLQDNPELKEQGVKEGDELDFDRPQADAPEDAADADQDVFNYGEPDPAETSEDQPKEEKIEPAPYKSSDENNNYELSVLERRRARAEERRKSGK